MQQFPPIIPSNMASTYLVHFFFLRFLGQVDLISWPSPLDFPSLFYHFIFLMSVWISYVYSYLLLVFPMVANLLSIVFDNVCNSVIVFFISIPSILSNFSRNPKVIFKNQFTLQALMYEISSCSISLPTLGIVSYLSFFCD